MAVVGFAGAEGPNFDLNNRDAEGSQSGGSVTIAAGSLRSAGKGSNHYVCDASTSGAGGLLSNIAVQCGSGSGATKEMLIFACQIDLVTTPAFDTPIATGHDGGAATFEVRYERLTDGKIHFFVHGTEINSTAAFTPTTGSPIGLAVVLALDTTHESELWYDSTAGGTFVKQQHGTSATAPSSMLAPSFCENLAKGVNHNWKLQVDDVVKLDNGGSYNATLPTLGSSTDYYEVVQEGRPSSDGGTNSWKDDTGVACGTSGNCAPMVADDSALTYIQITTSPATGGIATQTFPTSSLHLGSTDTVYGVGIGAKERIVTPNGWASQAVFDDGGTLHSAGFSTGTTSFYYFTGTPYYDHSPTSAVVWTPALAQAVKCGVNIAAGAGPAAIDFRVSEVYKFACYKPGAAAGFAHTYAVIV